MNKVLVFAIVILLAVGISLIIPEVREVIVNLAVYGRLSIGDDPGQIMRIFIYADSGDWVECPASGGGNCQRQISAEEILGEQVQIKAEIYDPNSDCESSYNVYAYVCKNTSTTPCNYDAGHYDTDSGQLTMSFDTENEADGLCNWTVNYNNLDYWKKWGVWSINVTARDASGTTQPNPDSMIRSWLNVKFGSLTYPYPEGSGYIDLGSITLDQWSLDRGENVTRNTGNTRLNISWSANEFSCAACTPPDDEIQIDDCAVVANPTCEILLIDNDTDASAGYGQFDSVPSTATIWYFPYAGVRRCGDDSCSQDEDGNVGSLSIANYTLWYNLHVLAPQDSGTYENTITISASPCDDLSTCGSVA